ncbi:hypothetical protein R4Z09_08140 [Niallia oryzisoli]|uniref:YpoC-like domain-containing protein n=1 Tax=Niallia oryzisoli TaxID=1737571 RepID=A0ABZ2CHC1_9BACI
MNSESISFPGEWSNFLLDREILWKEAFEQEFHANIPFLYDAAYFHGYETLKPWEISARTVPAILAIWSSVKAELHEKFSLRDQAAAIEPMKKGIGLFLEILYWSNQSPVLWKLNKTVLLDSKPVNWEERLNFIVTYLNKYHSYIQLTELFSEMEKLFIKHKIMSQAKKASKS